MKERIKQLLQHLEVSASEFADKLGVQRSAISHILAGRNNPSLDFLQKILNSYPQVSSEWLIMGSGEMEKEVKAKIQEAGAIHPVDKTLIPEKKERKGKTLEKVILIYEDGTFKEYKPSDS